MALPGGYASKRIPYVTAPAAKYGVYAPFILGQQQQQRRTGGGGGAGGAGGLVSRMEAQAEAARQANIARQQRIEGLHQEIIGRYRAGGAFEKAGLAEIGKGMKRGVGAETQRMISSGLYGTTTGAQVGRRWEESYAQPARLKLEDVMAQRLTAAQTGMAGFLERIEEPYPDYGAILPYLSQMGSTGGGATAGGFSISGNVVDPTGGKVPWQRGEGLPTPAGGYYEQLAAQRRLRAGT